MSNSYKEGDLISDIEELEEINKNIVLYFYPKDDTPGCTIEAKEFAELNAEFIKLDTVVLGVSKDSEKSHKKFKDKYELPFELISDKEGLICQRFDTWKKKKFMGREYMGISRETFLIGKDKIIKKIWQDVKPKGHAQEVIDAVKKLEQ